MTKSENRDNAPNDFVIGRSIRTMLITLMLMGIPLIGVLVYLNIKKVQTRNESAEMNSTNR